MLKEETKRKIIKKLFGMGLVRFFVGERPTISPGEFRYIISRYGVKRNDWFKVMKELQEEKILEYRKQYIYIFLKTESIMRIHYEKIKKTEELHGS